MASSGGPLGVASQAPGDDDDEDGDADDAECPEDGTDDHEEGSLRPGLVGKNIQLAGEGGKVS